MGFMVSFIHFHEQGFAMPPHLFLVGLLHYYNIQLHHLNPDGIQHMVTSVVLCEGYPGGLFPISVFGVTSSWLSYFGNSLHQARQWRWCKLGARPFTYEEHT